MKEKLIKFIENINETHLAIVVTLVCIMLTFGAYRFEDPNLQEMSNRSMKLSFFLLYAVSLIKALGTFKLDVMKEIIEEHNDALSRVLSALLLGGAACLLL